MLLEPARELEEITVINKFCNAKSPEWNSKRVAIRSTSCQLRDFSLAGSLPTPCVERERCHIDALRQSSAMKTLDINFSRFYTTFSSDPTSYKYSKYREDNEKNDPTIMPVGLDRSNLSAYFLSSVVFCIVFVSLCVFIRHYLLIKSRKNSRWKTAVLMTRASDQGRALIRHLSRF